MQSWQKIGLVLLGVLIIALAGVYLLVRSVLVPENVQLYIITRLEEIIKRPIAHGQIRIGMGGAIRIHDISVEDGDPLERGLLLTSPEMQLHCRILPLFSKKIVIDRIALRQPQIRLRRDAEGKFNISPHGAPPSGKESSAKGGMAQSSLQPTLILTVNHLALQDGTLIFTDYLKQLSQPLETTCKKINAHLSDFSVVSPFAATLSAEVQSTPPSILKLKAMIDPLRKQVTSDIKLTDVELSRIAPYFPDFPFFLTGGHCSLDLAVSANSSFDFSSEGTLILTEMGIAREGTPEAQLFEALAAMAGKSEIGINHRLSYQAAGDTLAVEGCAVTLRKITVSLQGRVEFLNTDPLCDITVTTDKVSAQSMLDALPADMSPALKNLSSSGTAEASLSIKGRLKKTDELAMSGFLSMDNLSLQSEVPPRWNIKIGGKTELHNQDVVINQLTATTGNSALSLTGKVTNCFTGPLTAQLRVSSPSMQAEEVMACITELGNLKKMLWDKDAENNKERKRLIDYKNMSVDAEAAVNRISYRSLKLSDLKASGRWSGNNFNLESLHGVMGDGAFTASSHVGLGDEGLDYTCRFTGNHLQLTPVLESIAPGRKESISGSADLAINLQGRGTRADDVKRNLTGEGTFTIRDGRVSGLESLESLASFIKMDALHTLTFDESQGTFQVGDGAISLQSSLKGKDIELYPTGTIGLDSDLDLLLDMRLAPQLSDRIADGVLTRYFKDEQGWTLLSLAIKGPAGEVVIMPASSTIKNISEMLVDILLKKEDASGDERQDKKKALEDLLHRLMQKSKDDKENET